MGNNSSEVVGIRGKTVDQILDLVVQKKHEYKEVVILGLTFDGRANMFKTNLPVSELSFLAKMMDFAVMNEFMSETKVVK